MKVAAYIPARLASTRLQNKLLLPLGDKSVLATTFLAARQTNLFSAIKIICDHPSLKEEAEKYGATALMSTKEHPTGTDRIAEFATQEDADIIINIQADEPFIQKDILEKIIQCFEDPRVQVASAKCAITKERDIDNPNYVKVVTDADDFAILFSRSRIPYHRSKDIPINYYKHIGIYAFRPEALRQFSLLAAPVIEINESLENLRFIYYNIPVKIIEIDKPILSIDTQEDYEKALQLLA